MNVENLFKVFNESWSDFKRKEKLEKYKFLAPLVNRVSVSNPYYLKKLPKHYFYNLVKEKFDVFVKDLGYACIMCEENCCFFSELEFVLKEIGIYEEDYEILKEKNGDLNGYVLLKNPDEYIFMKSFLGSDLDFSKFKDIKSKSLKLLGYAKTLNIIEKNGNFQCYYYNEVNRICRIHECKPIICHTFPIRVTNSWEKAGLQFCDDCNYIKKMIKQFTYDGYENKCNKMKSFWEYNIATMLFLKYKNRTEMKNGMLSIKKIEKYTSKFESFKDLIKLKSKQLQKR